MRPATTGLDDELFGATEGAPDRLIGLLIVSLFPALFWTAVLAFGANAIGHPLSALLLATFGAAIAAFLGAVANMLFTRTSCPAVS
jgi:hypothetical protein